MAVAAVNSTDGYVRAMKKVSMIFITCLFFVQTISQTIILFIYAIGKDKTLARTSVTGVMMKNVIYY